MRFERISRRRRGISTVISALIISAIVLAVGGAIWSFAQGTMTITAEDYAEAVITMTDTISERFIIEHVYYDENLELLYLWVFNYGDVDIEVKAHAKGVTYPVGEEWIEVLSKEMVPVQPIALSAIPGEDLSIKIYTKRGNNAYYRYLVP